MQRKVKYFPNDAKISTTKYISHAKYIFKEHAVFHQLILQI